MDPQEHKKIHSERHVKIICIGAGASGLILAYKLQKDFEHCDLTIYDKNPVVSGTWHENSYPGCACDVPAHNYTYSFDPKHDWSSVYAGSSEIKAYFQGFCDKHNLEKYIKTSHLVDHARWDGESGEWEIEVLNTIEGARFRDRCHILVYATGYLNNWAWPEVAGKDMFQGGLVHSANWDQDIELKGKKVALIGSGASAIQILPKIQPLASHVTNFVRSPLWVLPKIGDGADDTSPEQIERYRTIPGELTKRRKYNESVMNSIYTIYVADSPLQVELKRDLEESMRARLQNQDLEEALIPKFAVGCRRLCPDTGYLQSIKQPNVLLVNTGVSSFTEHGCVDDLGQEHHADVIICATGFNTTFIPRFPIIGSAGKNLQEIWNARDPESYMGIGVSDMPNFFMFLGPYSPVANGPTMTAIETQADYICTMINRYQTEPIKSFQPSASAQSDFIAHVGRFMEKSVLVDKCRSGHKNHTESGRIPTLWPGSTLHYVQALQEIRGEDWDIRHTGNRFSFLGNGISHAEFDPSCDLAYYIREKDDRQPLTRRGLMKMKTRSGTQPSRMIHRIHRPEIINL